MTKDEALRLALEALEKAKRQCQYHNIAPHLAYNEAITALRQALANQALDRMAENARELGLDYDAKPDERLMKMPDEPACQSCGVKATYEASAEATEFPGPYCDECGPAGKPATPSCVPIAVLFGSLPVYDRPQPAAWVSLTDEKIDELARTMVKGNKSVNWLARAIEAALRSKNT